MSPEIEPPVSGELQFTVDIISIAGVAWAAFTFAILLVLEVLGAGIITRLSDRLNSQLIRRRLRRRAAVVESGDLERWLIDFHNKTPSHSELATVSTDLGSRTLSIYSPSDWWCETSVDVSRSRPLIVRPRESVSPSTTEDEVPPTIRKRDRAVGTSSWNGRALKATRLPASATDSVEASESSFFEVAPQVIALEEEALRCAMRRWSRPRHRSRLAVDAPERNRGLGATAVVAAYSDESGTDGASVLIHRRSRTVATNPALTCVLPTFFVEAHRKATKQSKHDPVTWNALRELLEEAFGQEADLSRPTTHLDPDWFTHSSDAARDLEARIEASTLRIFHLGWYLNLLNGLLDMVILITVCGSEEELDHFKYSMEPSTTEIAHGPEAVEWIGLYSEDLSRRCLQPDFHGGSALAIQLARTAMRNMDPGPEV